jgi:hypothetical protein
MNTGAFEMRVHPDVGHWYRAGRGEVFEVVALDEDDGTVEVQYFDGTVAEFELEDWEAQRKNGEIEDAEPPEDWSGSVDVEDEEDGAGREAQIEDSPRRSDGLEGLDLFDAGDSSNTDTAATESPGTDGVQRR